MAGAELEIKADLVVQYLCTMSPGEEFLGSLISFVESDGASMPQQPGPFYQHFGSWVCVEYICFSSFGTTNQSFCCGCWVAFNCSPCISHLRMMDLAKEKSGSVPRVEEVHKECLG